MVKIDKDKINVKMLEVFMKTEIRKEMKVD